MAGVEEDLDLSEEFVSCDEEPTPSSSGPVEEVVDVVSSDTETDAGVPEIDVNGLLSDAIVKKFRQRVVEELKDAYRGEGTTELVQAVNTIVDLYARAYQHKAGARFVQLLLLDLERRLYFMIDNENYLVGRLRTLSVIARFATGLVHKEATHSDVLDFLIDFIKKNEYNSSPASRALVCYLAGEVLVSSVGAPIIKQLYVYDVNMEVEDDDEEYPVCLSLDAFTKIYSVLESRSQDKYPNVRKEAIRAIGHVQDRDIWGEYQALVEVQPYEVVVGHIIDESPDVRTIAIKSLLISESDRVRDLVSIAVTDPDWNVQKEAYLRICQDLHIGAFSVEERMSLLETVCYHKELLMRESAIKLITSWATQLCREIQKKGLDPDGDGGKDIPMSMYARTPLYILNYLDVLGNTELSQTVMLHLFYMAAIRYPDIATTQAYVLLIKDENAVLNRQNFRSIMFRKLSLADIAHRIFFWRMFAIYGQRASKDAAEWAEVTHQLFPSLRPFCEFVLEFVTFISKKFEGEEMEAYKIFAITELLKIAKLLDRDVVGVASWRNMLSSILTSQVIPTDKNLIDLCVCDLFAYHFPKKDDVSSAIAEVCDATSLLISRAANSTVMNDSISLAQHGDPYYQPGLEDMEAAPEMQAHGETLTHCLMIVDAMMRTGRVTNMNDPFVSGIYENFIEKGAVSTKAEDRRYALRCFATMCMHNENVIRLKLPVLQMALKVELPQNKSVVVSGISDIVMRWGYKKISALFGRVDLNGKELSLAEVFAEMMDDPKLVRNQVAESVARSLMKWMMLEHNEEWKVPLARFLVFWARPDATARKSERRGTIAQFLKDYTAKSRQNRVFLAQSVFHAIEWIKKASTRSPIASVDPEDIADKIVELTDESGVEEKTEKKKGSKQSTPVDAVPSVHTELMGMVLQHLYCNPGDRCIGAYVKILSMVNLDDLRPEIAVQCDWSEQLKEILDEMDEDDTKTVKMLRSFIRNFESRMRSAVATRRRQPSRVQSTRSRATVSATRSDGPSSTTSSVESSKEPTPNPLSCKELASSLPTIDEDPQETNGSAEKPPEKEAPEPVCEAKKAPAPSRIPTRSTRATTRARRDDMEQKGGRDDAVEEISDLASGVVRLQLTDARRPLGERNRAMNAANSGATKGSLSTRTRQPGNTETAERITYFPSDDDDDEFVTRRPRRPATRQNPVRGTRRAVAAPSENDE